MRASFHQRPEGVDLLQFQGELDQPNPDNPRIFTGIKQLTIGYTLVDNEVRHRDRSREQHGHDGHRSRLDRFDHDA